MARQTDLRCLSPSGPCSKTVQFTYMLICVFNLLTNCWGSFPWHFLVLSKPEPNNTDRLGADFRKPKTSARPAERSHWQKVPLSKLYVGRQKGVCLREVWSDGIWSKVGHTAWDEEISISYWKNGLKKKRDSRSLKSASSRPMWMDVHMCEWVRDWTK